MNDNLICGDPRRILSTDKCDLLYPCIQDLVDNGLDLTRFTSTERLPSRQDITQYLAAWCRHAGLSDEDCRGWLIEYCVNMLSAISKTSASGIRHSTKSNVKYIYRTDIQFVCDCESNPFKARCCKSCPRYTEMKTRSAEKKDQVRTIGFDIKKPAPITDIDYRPIKERFKDQFEEALAFIRSQIEMGIKKRYIIKQLNERGFKTRTGRLWTDAILQSELKNVPRK